MFPRKHSLLPLPVGFTMCGRSVFFSLCTPLDCFKISFCDDCIFHSASAMSLHWTEPHFHSNLDLPVYRAPCGAVFQSLYIVADFTFQGFLFYLFIFPTKCFHHSGSFAPTCFCKMVPMVIPLIIFLCALHCPLSSLPSEDKVVSQHLIHNSFVIRLNRLFWRIHIFLQSIFCAFHFLLKKGLN